VAATIQDPNPESRMSEASWVILGKSGDYGEDSVLVEERDLRGKNPHT
jgi:hypothetical protein